MELRVKEVDGKLMPVVVDECGVYTVVNNVEFGLEVTNLCPNMWRVSLSAFFQDD